MSVPYLRAAPPVETLSARIKPDTAPPDAPPQTPVSNSQLIFSGAKYAIYAGAGYLVADTWLGGNGLVGAGVGVVGGYMIERVLEYYLMTEGEGI